MDALKRIKARRRRMRRQRLLKIGAWTCLILAELIAAAVPATAMAAVLIPLVQMERGYTAQGSEWLAVAVIFCIAYAIIHNLVCNKIYNKEG